mgnify:CR=1 FL=1
MNKGRISVHLPSKNRPTELSLLLQSLRTQTYQDFDIIILDDGSGTPILNYGFMACMIARLKLESHRVKIIRNDISLGVTKARNKLLDEDFFGNEFVCRLDDDVICESDYLEKLISVIDSGYDLASGVTPPMMYPEVERETRFVKPIINDVVLDEKGEVVKNGDDCGYGYIEPEIIPTPHFRSCALYRKSSMGNLRYETNINFFREEEVFSFRAILQGCKLGVHTGAKVLHQLTSSGGNKDLPYAECVKIDENTFLLWVKKVY